MPVEIDCSVDSKNVVIDLYKSTTIKREKLVPNGKTLKRKGNVFTLVIQSFRDTGKYICTAKRYGTLYEKAITIAVVGTGQLFCILTSFYFQILFTVVKSLIVDINSKCLMLKRKYLHNLAVYVSFIFHYLSLKLQ